MSTRRLALHAAVWLGMAVVLGVLLLQACTPPCAREEHGACWYGEELTDATRAEIARVLPLLPADPWPCVKTVVIGRQHPLCPETAGCYIPDTRTIYTKQQAFAHELGHAAAECAYGHPDYKHESPWWGEVR